MVEFFAFVNFFYRICKNKMCLSMILSKFGSSWTKKFKEYFTVARKIMAANPDEEDLAIMAALIMLTADRHDFLSKEQRQVICTLQVKYN